MGIDKSFKDIFILPVRLRFSNPDLEMTTFVRQPSSLALWATGSPRAG